MTFLRGVGYDESPTTTAITIMVMVMIALSDVVSASYRLHHALVIVGGRAHS